jgi:hypothetical protein
MRLVYWYSITLGVQVLFYFIMLHLVVITVFNPVESHMVPIVAPLCGSLCAAQAECLVLMWSEECKSEQREDKNPVDELVL